VKEFRGLIVRAVLVTYAVWGSVLISDLLYCRVRSNSCDNQTAEIKGAAAAIPAVLLGWLADSPVRER
jgi:hypothetical protein